MTASLIIPAGSPGPGVGCQAETLLRMVEVLHTGDDLTLGLERALDLCGRAFGADAAALLHRTAEPGLQTFVSTDPGLAGQHWGDDAPFTRQGAVITEVGKADPAFHLPPAAAGFRSLIAAPLDAELVADLHLVLLAREPARFAPADLAVMTRAAGFLARAVHARRLQERNALLQAIIEGGKRPRRPDSTADSGFSALSQAFDRLAQWQNRVVRLNSDLLTASGSTLNQAIGRALAEIGELAGSDRTYVFRLRPPDRLDNTHEWVAPGIAPMIDLLQDMPADLLDDWRPELEAGRAVYIPDVDALPDDSEVGETLRMQGIRSLLAVPLQRDGCLTGFVGYDSVGEHRRFLPTEITLLQSVAATIGAVIDRQEAEIAARQYQDGLAEERDRLRATLAALPDLVLELDPEGRFIDYNFGGGTPPAFPPELFLGRLPEDVLPPELAGTLRTLMHQVSTTGHSHGNEYQMAINGVPRWFAVSVGARRKGGKAAGYVFIIRDVTARHEQDREIRRLSRIATLTSNLVVVADAEGRIDWVNPAFETRTGWHLDEVRGRKPGHFLQYEGTDPATARRVSAALRRGEPVQAELRNRCRDGTEYWISKDIQPLLDESGRLEGFVSVQTDITELKASHLREMALRAAAIESSADGIAISGPDGRYIDMNPAHRKMFGIPADAEITSLGWTELTTREDADEFQRLHWPKLAAEGRWQGQIRGRRLDGSIFDIDVALTLTDNNELVCIARDITERRQTETERDRLRDELQLAHRRETVAHVAAGVAHDLNNLVAVVLGTVQTLLANPSLRDEIGPSLRRIARAMDTARDLVDGLGTLGRPDRPRGPEDLRKLVLEAIDLLGSERTQRHGVHAVLPAAPLTVWANRTEFLQVVLNLTLNACEAGDGATNRVTLTAVDGDDGPMPADAPDVGCHDPALRYRILQVCDTGSGVAPALRRRLFERYMTTKGHAGTGMGLAIVAGIVRDNHAVLWFDSQPGKGSTVTVAWPVEDARATGSRQPAVRRGRSSDLSSHRIMVVDDNADVADVMCEMIEATGAIAVTVTDPLEARSLLLEDPGLWSAVVTDFDMPGLNGAQLAHVARHCDPQIACILVTALPAGSGWEHGQFGAVHGKPVDAEALRESLTALIGNRGPLA